MTTKRNRITLQANIDIDFKFFAILPAVNINLHSKEIEIEWLIFGLYVSYIRPAEKVTSLNLQHRIPLLKS